MRRLALALLLTGCRLDANVNTVPSPPTTVRWLTLEQTAPHGGSAGTHARVVGTAPDGTKTWVLVLAQGDDVTSALLAFAKKENVQNAHFVAIGGVKDPEAGWYDLTRKQYKAMTLNEQVEVLTLSGDVALSPKGEPAVHAHAVFGRSDGTAWGGHVLHAEVAPMLEVYLTQFPSPLQKKHEDATGIDRIDP